MSPNFKTVESVVSSVMTVVEMHERVGAAMSGTVDFLFRSAIMPLSGTQESNRESLLILGSSWEEERRQCN